MKHTLSIIEINLVLEQLIGLPLTRTSRAASMQSFQFGILKVISDKQAIGQFGLHIISPWRITSENEVLVGSYDLYQQADETAEYDEDFNWEVVNSNLRDTKLNHLLSEMSCIVETANADKYGGLTIGFRSGIELTIFPDNSSRQDAEFWRLLDNREETRSHYVSTSIGYEVN